MNLQKMKYKLNRLFKRPLRSPTDTKLWGWFGLTYASYLVLPRSIICDMPLEWQDKFGELLEELDNTFKCAPLDGHKYFVYTRDTKGRFIEDQLKYYRHPDYNLLDSIRLKPRE